jgi:hypothetical protein
MAYQLWETESANLVGSYATKDAALAIVRESAQTYGADSVATLLLLHESASGRLKKIADGSALVALAANSATPAA